MIYVGKSMRSLRGFAMDPALINPSLSVSKDQPDTVGRNLHYWPSYSEVHSTSRAAYLNWLAGGRRDPKVAIGYVFLFFYGIERRVLLDAMHSDEAIAEVPALLTEVQELLHVYGGNGSFGRYANAFMDLMVAAASDQNISQLVPPREKTGWEIPFFVKLVLGHFVTQGKPIPAEWAFSWVVTSPKVFLRTPAQRCPDEFEQLFLIRYREKYGDGMVIKRNKANLSVVYRPASATFLDSRRIDLDLPDVTLLAGPTNKLWKLADEVQIELEGYSRWVGRNHDRHSLAALALLPAELVKGRDGADIENLVAQVEHSLGSADMAIIDPADLVALWPVKEDGKLDKREAAALAKLLGSIGYGIEPDVRFSGSNLSRSDRAVIFRGEIGTDPPSTVFMGASALLHFGAVVASADDDIADEEERQLREHLEQTLHLSASERLRLRAHMQWLLVCPPSTSAPTAVLRAVPEAARHRLGRVLPAPAGPDGHVSPDELKVLAKIYPLLGLDPDTLYGDVHELTALPSQGPVTLLPADDGIADFAIRRSASETDAEPNMVTLDLDRIAAIRAETSEVSRMLGAIFSGGGEFEQEDSTAGLSSGHLPVASETTEPTLLGLDAAHSALVRALAERQKWQRAEFGALADNYGLMASGAIEIINEAAFAVCDEPLLEGDSSIEINPYALQEMLA
jgi:tellurite resistance protein